MIRDPGFVASFIDKYTSAQSVCGDSIAESAEVENLEPISGVTEKYKRSTHLDICYMVTLHCSNTSSIIELDLPHPTKVGEQIAHTLSGLHIPHFQSPVRP